MTLPRAINFLSITCAVFLYRVLMPDTVVRMPVIIE